MYRPHHAWGQLPAVLAEPIGNSEGTQKLG